MPDEMDSPDALKDQFVRFSSRVARTSEPLRMYPAEVNPAALRRRDADLVSVWSALLETLGVSNGHRFPNLCLTLANVWPYGLTTASVDPATGYFTWGSDPAGDLPPLNGTDGIVDFEDELWSVSHIWGESSYLTVCDRHLNGRLRHRLPDTIGDAHDLRRYRDGWAIADTAHDRVVYYNMTDGSESTIWAASAENADTQHVNSLAVLGERLFATVIGPKVDNSWREAASGYIVDCATGEQIVTGLRQPHSLIEADGALWWCESASSTLWRWHPEEGQVRIAELKGYIRGLAITPSCIYVCANARRNKSRHLGTNIPIKDQGIHVDESALFVIDRHTGKVMVRSLMHISAEIFAILPIDDRVPAPTLAQTFESLRTRFDLAARFS